jgi:hypothetical protein
MVKRACEAAVGFPDASSAITSGQPVKSQPGPMFLNLIKPPSSPMTAPGRTIVILSLDVRHAAVVREVGERGDADTKVLVTGEPELLESDDGDRQAEPHPAKLTAPAAMRARTRRDEVLLRKITFSRHSRSGPDRTTHTT